MRPWLALLAMVALISGCGGGARSVDSARVGGFGPAPDAPSGELNPEVAAAAEVLVSSGVSTPPNDDALAAVASSGDPRLAWLLSDLLRFAGSPAAEAPLLDAYGQLTGADARAEASATGSGWLAVTNQLIAWDLPAPLGYRALKGRLFTSLEPGWKPFFADADSEIDWRLVSWGGVPIDDRRLDDPNPCPRGCIPALDDPKLTDAAGGDWYDDNATVFGIVVGGHAVAFPKNIMEVQEMVNITIAGRRLGIPYCTLCGSAQAYYLDSVPTGVREPVLRTSGLLSRSNKVMYDLRSASVLDTFTGRALSGPLQDAGVELEQASVEVSTWGGWKRAHPGTEIVAEDGGIGREYPDDPLGGRDDAGPIFPVGDVDPRLPVQEQVLGVDNALGKPIAFPVAEARQRLADGQPVTLDGVEVVSDGGGLRTLDPAGRELTSHQAFWFAWSQFNPKTQLWRAPTS